MSREKLKKVVILDRIKKAYGFKTDAQLADFLGIKSTHLAVWRARDSINLDLIITKCSDLNLNWLLTGQGSMFLNEQSESNAIQVNNKAEEYAAKERQLAELRQEIEHLKAELKKMDTTDEKDAARMAALKEHIRELELENSKLLGQIGILKELLNKKLGLNGA